ncbi:thioesterase family protein [Ruegeria sediminis]|uniref:Thioesterase family protein n=1 Tax=Ruegeria sediminis TaxID=2583820 RepID=A0ABY2WXS4_9RHOB|nr:thioesterase family protein [Ruegeria sediminis]TMV07663.1 thioesterase family protein [Ruegeria sediminis]
MEKERVRESYFHLGAGGVFVGNDPVRGPWSPDHCHAGPVTGLIARAAEREVGPEKMLTRLTVDVLRPLPLTGLRVSAETVRHTRTLATTRVTVHDPDETLCATATTMHLVRKKMGEVRNAQVPSPRIEDAEPGPFPIRQARHDLPYFAQFVDVLYPKGQSHDPGPKTIWMRAPPLLEGERQSPIQSLCPLADCGNGISWNAPPTEMGFMNTDLSVHVHREPVSEWLASESVSHWHANGIGMAQAVLYDTNGPVATALQTLVLFPPG